METATKYQFDQKKHLHTLDGKPLTGCTTVLSVIAKPALIQWAANMAVESIKGEIYDCSLVPPREILDGIFERARSAHRQKKETAGDWGTAVHAAVETWIKENKLPIDLDENGLKVFDLFRNWSASNKVTFFESEMHIYSEKHWLGGIVDLVLDIGGQTWIADIKTSSGIYEEAFFQMAGYHLMLEEMGLYPNITGYIVLNLKKDGTFEEKRSISNEDNREAFLAALKLYRVKEKIKKQIIK